MAAGSFFWLLWLVFGDLYKILENTKPFMKLHLLSLSFSRLPSFPFEQLNVGQLFKTKINYDIFYSTKMFDRAKNTWLFRISNVSYLPRVDA